MKVSDFIREVKREFVLSRDSGHYCGLCMAFVHAYERHVGGNGYHYNYILSLVRKNIPEFTPTTFGRPITLLDEFWWDEDCVVERVQALDKLLGIYKDSDKEFIINFRFHSLSTKL